MKIEIDFGGKVMLSKEALKWLESIEYQKFTHEERIILLQAAMIIYPDNEEVERG